MMKELYSAYILDKIPVILSLQDRNDRSAHFGCFDRNYWHYRFIDFPSADMQCASLILALIYKKTGYPENPYQGKAYIRDCAIAGMRYWAKIVSPEGSCSEWYPNECSFVSTAFTSYAVSEALLVLADEVAAPDRATILAALTKAGGFLARNNELSVCNQQAVAIAALYNLSLLTGGCDYSNAADKKFRMLKGCQTPEGWFPEYGGMDVGYSTMLLGFLARYYEKSKNEEVIPVADKLIDYLKYCVHPDFTWGGMYGSRNTEYFLPCGFEILSRRNRISSILANTALSSLKTHKTVWDERYLTNIGYDYLQAFDAFHERDTGDLSLPFTGIVSRYCPESNLYFSSTPAFYTIIGASKGAVVRIFDKRSKIQLLNDTGIICRLSNKTVASNQFLDRSNEVNVRDRVITVKSSFYEVRRPTLQPVTMIVLRTVQLISSWNAHLAALVRASLRRLLITGKKKVPITAERKISIGDTGVTIEDEIRVRDTVTWLSVGGVFNLIAIPSSNYFKASDADTGSLPYVADADELKKLNSEKRLVITRTIRP